MNRQEWNELATEKTSGIVGGEVEVSLMVDTISIYSESKPHAYAAAELYQKAGSQVLREVYYEADEDGPDSWFIEVSME